MICGSVTAMFVRNRTIWLGSALGAMLLVASPSAFGQDKPPVAPTAQLKDLKAEDYPQWESLSRARLSDNGKFTFAQISMLSGESKLMIRNTDGPQLSLVPLGSTQDLGSGAAFSDDSLWIAYVVAPAKAVADKARDERKQPELKVIVKSLANGEEFVFDGAGSFQILKGSRTVLIRRQKAADAPTAAGADLIAFSLEARSSMLFSGIQSYVLNESETLVAMELSASGGLVAIQTYEPTTSVLRTVDIGKFSVGAMRFAEKQDSLAYLRGRKVEGKDVPANSVVLASDLRRPSPTLRVFDPERIESFPKGKRITESSGIRLNEDASIVLFGMQSWPDPKKPETRPQDKPSVEIWNSKDLRMVPEQKVTLPRDRATGQPVAWRPGNESNYQVIAEEKDLAFFQTTVGSGAPLYVGANLLFAVIMDASPYAKPNSDGATPFDIYRVDTVNGKRERIATAVYSAPQMSRTGKYLAFWQRGHWSLVDLASGSVKNLTGKVKVSFADEIDDHAVPEVPPVDGPEWFANDEACILYDRFDAWLYRPGTGDLSLLTQGRKESLRFRFEDVEDRPEGPSLSGPFYFRAQSELTKAAGYYLSDGKGGGKMLAFDNITISGLSKVKGGDRLSFTMGSFEKSPNLFVTNGQFTAIKPVTTTNPQQASYKWGKTELVTYRSRWGLPLQGTLIYPAGYEKGKRYPMVTYIYERLSDGLNSYIMPTEWNPYNAQILSQSGYFVLMPDIAYRKRQPGQSAVDCLEPALDAVFKLNVGVDPSKVGLIGHSWGGYQTAFVTTVSKKFAVGVAGAPLTELTSMYNSVFWNAGITDQVLMETSQGRMEVPFWEDLQTYLKNSPVHRSLERTTPLLIAHGTVDGAVPYQQGYYLFNTLRRMGKNAVFLSYAGENHNFTRRPNQLDYSRRLRHYLDVYLKGVPAEPWVTEGVPFIKQADGS